jgi:hypothetical protein
MYINRNWKRSESDDFKLNVQDHIKENTEAVPVYATDDNGDHYLCGWRIQLRYEYRGIR